MNTKQAIRLLARTCALVLAGALSLAAPAFANQWAAEGNVSLRGTNLTYFPQPDQAQCLSTCANNGSCKGATWIQAGTYSPRDPAMCYLLSAVTERVAARGHFSMVKTVAPPPPPPPPPNTGCTPGHGFECDTNRNGSDYAGFDLAQANPQLCLDRCRGDNSCRAWTYVKPGLQGANARCYLKNPAPPATANNCCVSGAMPRIIDQQVMMEVNINRNGSDYARFEMPTANPDQCFERCRGDNRCAAWTFVRPGVQGPQAVCYLKNPAPPPTPNNCCVSGAVQGTVTPPVTPPPPPPPPPPPNATGVTWYTAAKSNTPDGQRSTYMCPPLGPGGYLSIWGTDVYTYDSGICLAGAHVGVITREGGGLVTIEMRPGQSSYPASTRNGIASQGYGSYTKSFAIVR